jgi:hypothetical protein
MKFILSLAMLSLLTACGSSSTGTEDRDSEVADTSLNSDSSTTLIQLSEDINAVQPEDIDAVQPEDIEAVQLPSSEDNSANQVPPTPVQIASQSFQNFYTGAGWYLTNFDLPAEAARGDYINQDGEILFQLNWTKQSRNLMADRLGYDREVMTNEFTSEMCAPKLEVGKASVYKVGDSANMVAELDSDLSHCNINGNEPANVNLRSFIPTKVGYNYQVTAMYQMRDYNMPKNAYRHFVMRFGSSAEHFEPVFNGFTEASIDIVATHKYSVLVLRDNGLPDSYGILVDDIKVSELGKVAHYNACAALFAENSKGFRKCIAGEVDTNQSCSMDAMTAIKYSPGAGITEHRSNIANAFVNEEAIQGSINFLSLGLKGKLKVGCYIDGYAATYPIFNKQISLREISWGNATPQSYPEQARIRVQLTSCDNDELNGNNHLGIVSTGESFSYDFTQNIDGVKYSGCRLKSAMIIDKTPASSPSTDGFDVNSVNITDALNTI